MKKIITATLLTISICSFSSTDNFSSLKEKIDHLENSIIQDFSIDLPKNKKGLTAQEQVKLANQVEVKYGIQRTLFFKIEEEFFQLNRKLKSHVKQGLLSLEEAEKLKTSIDYANRIILKSRKAEINQIYSEFMSKLSHRPKLDDIYTKLAAMDVKNCSFENLNLSHDSSILSFNIKQKNKFGNWTSSHYQITEQDIQAGHLTSRLDKQNSFIPFQNIITNYWNADKANSGKGHQKFTLLQDEHGNIKEAKFNQETEEPLISFLGFSIGTQKVKKFFECENMKKFFGPSPASVKNDN